MMSPPSPSSSTESSSPLASASICSGDFFGGRPGLPFGFTGFGAASSFTASFAFALLFLSSAAVTSSFFASFAGGDFLSSFFAGFTSGLATTPFAGAPFLVGAGAPFVEVAFDTGVFATVPFGAGFDPAVAFPASFFFGSGFAAAFFAAGLAAGFDAGLASGLTAGFAATLTLTAPLPATLLAPFGIGFFTVVFDADVLVVLAFSCVFAGDFFAGAFAATFTGFFAAGLVGLATGFLTGLALAFFATTGVFFAGAFLAGDLLDLLTGSTSFG